MALDPGEHPGFHMGDVNVYLAKLSPKRLELRKIWSFVVAPPRPAS